MSLIPSPIFYLRRTRYIQVVRASIPINNTTKSSVSPVLGNVPAVVTCFTGVLIGIKVSGFVVFSGFGTTGGGEGVFSNLFFTVNSTVSVGLNGIVKESGSFKRSYPYQHF